MALETPDLVQLKANELRICSMMIQQKTRSPSLVSGLGAEGQLDSSI